MAPSNSTKKLAKVARSGKKRSIRESSDRTYPMAIAAIVIVGILAVAWGRSERASAQRTAPTLDDHWHAAYGLYLCDAFAPPPSDVAGDPLGIHSHEDGIIHVHPFSSAATGENATIGKFFDTIGLDVSDDKIVTVDGTTYESGTTTCPSGAVGTVALVEWKSADDTTAAPTVITKNITDTRIVNDRMAFTLAFVPEADVANVPRPESIPQLDNLTDVEPSQIPTNLDDLNTSTTAGDATATTAVDGTATTAVGDTPTTAATSATTPASTSTSAASTTTGG